MRAAGVLPAVRGVAAGACSLLLGALVAVLGAFQHQRDVDLLGARVPAGVVLGLVALVLAQWLVRELAGRAGVVLLALSWLVVSTVLGSSRSEGDLVISGDGRGAAYFWLGSLTCVAGAFAWAYLGGRDDALRDPGPRRQD